MNDGQKTKVLSTVSKKDEAATVQKVDISHEPSPAKEVEYTAKEIIKLEIFMDAH